MNKGEITRQRIIEQAAPLFNRHGYAGCSLQDLMQATGLEKGGIYRHFAGKEELATEALRYSLRCLAEARLAPLHSPASALDQLRHAIESFVHVPSPIPGGCPLMNTAVNSADGNPNLLGLARDTLAVWKQRLENIVQTGIETGEIKPGTNPRRIANLLIAMLEGAHLLTRLEGSLTSLQDVRVTLDGLLEDLSTAAR